MSVKRDKKVERAYVVVRKPSFLSIRRKHNLINNKFDKLTVIGYIGINYNNHILWACTCDCGNLAIATGFQLQRNKNNSCGCSKQKQNKTKFKERLKNPIKLLTKHLFNIYSGSAKRRNIKFNLTLEEFSALVISNCFYCGENPERQVWKYGLSMNYNGIDRFNNVNGYINDNVLPACYKCNRMKADMSVDEFVGYINRLSTHYITTIKRNPTEEEADEYRRKK